MPARTADDIRGYEYDWLACDADGHVALFSTAGGGFAPEEFLRDTEAHDAAIDAIVAEPASTRARFAPHLKPGLESAWIAMAERGLFAFDSDPCGGPYRLVAAPERPIRVPELPQAAAGVVRRLECPRVRFPDVQEVSADMLQRHR